MSEPAIVFYDGACGMCHGAVRFLLARDSGGVMRFAALGGSTLAERLTADQIAALPDSLVLLEPGSGALWLKSEAVRRSLLLLGGGWVVPAALMRVVPRVVRDLVYDFIASVRHRIAAPPPDACPLVAPEVRSRFLP